MVALARYEPIVCQVVAETCSRATSAVVVFDGSFPPRVRVGRIHDDQPCDEINDDQARVVRFIAQALREIREKTTIGSWLCESRGGDFEFIQRDRGGTERRDG